MQPRLDIDDRLLLVLDRPSFPALRQGNLVYIQAADALSEDLLAVVEVLSCNFEVVWAAKDAALAISLRFKEILEGSSVLLHHLILKLVSFTVHLLLGKLLDLVSLQVKL